MFMHENVKRFVVTLPNIMDQRMGYLSSYFDNVIDRMPMLTHLELLCGQAMEPERLNMLCMDEIEDDVLELIRGLPNLHVVLLSPGITSRLVEGLSHLPNLAEIDCRPDPEVCYDIANYVEFEPSLVEGAFPSLNYLAHFAVFAQTTLFLKTPFFPSNLTVLQIESPWVECPSDLHMLSVAIAENCQLLTALYLLISCDRGAFEETGSIGDIYERITLDSFRPLLSCPNIKTFEIVHQDSFDLQLEDIEEIASKWPSLETLKLNNDPVIFPAHESPFAYQSLPTLRSLLPFARHCPRLQHLGLFLRASMTDIPAAHELQSFQRLECLSMGVSYLAEEGPVTHFLSQICPVGCRVESSDKLEGEVGELLRRRWKTVDEWLPLLMRSRMEERRRMREENTERVRALEAELAAFRSGLFGHGNSNIAMQ